MKKVLWVKFGWSDYYRGGPVDGNFGWLREQRGKKDEGRGHEAFNFMPASDGTYYCYVPPQAGEYAPKNKSSTGWTVICLAKNPKHTGIHVVGWYENATLLGKWKNGHPAVEAGERKSWSYCITSKSARLVPPEQRNIPFSDPQVRLGKYSFLAGPGVQAGAPKKRVLKLLESKLGALGRVAIRNPDPSSVPDPETNPGDPLIVFGTPEHRKAVEEAAERAIVRHYRNEQFREKRVAELNRGFDYIFRKGQIHLHVEVKGTSTAREGFFLTRNENNYRNDPRWRLGMVTNALSRKPCVNIYDHKAFREKFDIEPYVFIGKPIIEPETD